MNLFSKPIDEASDPTRPLADRMRPRDLDEFVGQEHILAPGKALRVQIEHDDIGSILFWGPPGVGKTTLAKIIARRTKAEFVEFSAVMAGIKEIKSVMVEAERARQYGTRTIVFIDEIHRFNKAQQDSCGARQHSADWGDYGESFVRGDLRAALALAGVHAESSDRGADCFADGEGIDRRRARTWRA
jgi:ATPase subunit of ABC transporter with duplicated ATPase domains